MRLQDRVAIVTGAASGNGLAIAEGFLAEGAKVVFADIDKDTLQLLKKKHANHRDRTMFCEMDVSDLDSIQTAVDQTVSTFGKLDILVSNAGVTVRKHFLEQKETDYDFVSSINVKGVFFTGQIAAQAMIDTKRKGVIINMSSIASIIAPQKNIVPYGASKGAVLSMTKHMAYDLSDYQIRVNAIAPGTIVTKINQQRLSDEWVYEKEVSKNMSDRLGDTKDVVGAAVFLASDESAFMNGTQIVIDGGETAR